MTEKIIDIGQHIEKRDMDLILEVNKKAVEIQTEVADQNEEIISQLSKISANQEKVIAQSEKISTQNEHISKDLFKVQVLFITGILALIAQIIQIIWKH